MKRFFIALLTVLFSSAAARAQSRVTAQATARLLIARLVLGPPQSLGRGHCGGPFDNLVPEEYRFRHSVRTFREIPDG